MPSFFDTPQFPRTVRLTVGFILLIVPASQLLAQPAGAPAKKPDLVVPPAPGSTEQAPTDVPPSPQAPTSPGSPASPKELEHKELEQQLRAALQRDPLQTETIVALANLLVKDKRTDEAIQLLEQSVADSPENAKLALTLGQAYLAAQELCAAINQLETLFNQCPHEPDLMLSLSNAYLQAKWPITAYRAASYEGPVSSADVRSGQTLIRGSALAQIGMRCEASTLFGEVQNGPASEELVARAAQLQHEMDEALESRPRFYGNVAATERYDTNPGIVPTVNLFGNPTTEQPSWGNQITGVAAYDVVRDYNTDVTAGLAFLHTTNYTAGAFNLLDTAPFLNYSRRAMWGDVPVQGGARVDYDYLLVGSDAYLQRGGITPNLTLYDTDFSSLTGIARYTRLDFLQQGSFENSPRDADSDDYALGFSRQHQTASRQFSYLYGYIYDRNSAEGPDFRYNGHQVQTGFNWTLWEKGAQVALLGSVYWRNYDDPDTVFLQTRRDVEYGLQTVVLYPLADSWFATFAWRLDRNESNLASSNYSRQTFDIGVQYNFGQPALNAGSGGDYARRTTY